MSLINRNNLVAYFPLDGYALDRSAPEQPLSYTSLVNDASLRAYYKLEDVNDSSGNGYTLTNNNSVAFNAAKFGKGADYGNSNTNKRLSIASNLGITNSVMTMSVWFNINTQPASGIGYTFFMNDNNSINIAQSIGYNNTSGTYGIYIDRTRQGIASNTLVISLAAYLTGWHLLTGVFDGTNEILYLDGELKGTQGASGNGSSGGLNFSSIGCSDYNGTVYGYASSIFDDIAIFSRALSAEEVKVIYNAGRSANHGTVYGALPVPSQNSAIPASLAYKFVSASATNRIVIPNTSTLKPTQAITVGAWVYASSLADYRVIITTDGDASWDKNLGYGLVHTTGTTIGFWVNHFSNNSVYGNLPLNKWTWCVGTYDKINVKFYINGDLVGIDPYTADIAYGTENIVIGSGSGTSSVQFYWDGKIQEVFEMNTALTPQTIKQIYNKSKWKYGAKNVWASISQAVSNFFLFFN